MASKVSPSSTDRGDTMSLLRRVVDDAVDPGYARSASETSGQTLPGPRRPGSHIPRHAVLALTLLMLGALIAATVAQVRQGAPGVQRARVALLTQVEAATQTTDELAQRVDTSRMSVDALRTTTLRATQEGRQVDERLASLAEVTGSVALQGPGASVVLDDGPPSRVDPGQPDLARVLDRDLQRAVNGLFAAGAEAVSVNGQRITSLSPIRGAGGAILVGYRPLTPPYTVTALGDVRTLASDFEASPDGQALQALAQTYGIRFDVSTSEALEVPAAGAVTLRYARAEGDQ
ncbi:MAG: DUF881 domain-containing protein [Actinomycetes bacterium]